MDPKNYHCPKAGQVVLATAGYWAFIPAPLPPDIVWSESLVSILSEAERYLSRLETLAQTFQLPHHLFQPFIRKEAVISSRIEGTRASLEDLYEYEISPSSNAEESDDVREVHNYVRALDYGLERMKSLPISLRLIRELHEKLMENVRGGYLSPGEFRRSQNWIGPAGCTLVNAPYVPPPIEEMHQALDSLEKFIHTNTQIPSLVRAGMIYYQFEAIHPFLDGNGRIGRLLIILLFHKWGLLTKPLLNLSEYIERHRQEYYDRLLHVSQEGRWELWLNFFLRGVSEQSQNSIVRMERLYEIRAKYQPVIDDNRLPNRMSAIIDFLFSRPILSIRQVAEGVNLPYKTAQDYIEKLVSAGILHEITGYSRNRIYRAEEVIRVLQE